MGLDSGPTEHLEKETLSSGRKVEAKGANRNGENSNQRDGQLSFELLAPRSRGLTFPMQLRASSFVGDRPSCPWNPHHPVHKHGYYERYANGNDCLRIKILVFLCVRCRHTLSVLPDQVLPYRAISAPLVQAHFDAQAQSQPIPPVTEKEKGCLQRAWARFQQRVKPLTAVLGQMVETVTASAAPLWDQLRRWGNLPAILLQLARPFKTSLLLDYRCLQPWPAPAA